MWNKIVVGLTLASLLVGSSLFAIEEPQVDINAKDPAQNKPPVNSAFKTEQEQISYCMGIQVGQQLKKMELDLNIDIFTKGIQDVISDKKLLLTEEEISAVLSDFYEQMQAKRQQEWNDLGIKNEKEGKVFLEANKEKEGVTVLPSGLQYKVLRDGTGKKPIISDQVKVHYKGTLLDGTVFDSSYERNQPADFVLKPGGLIQGWIEALPLMSEGAKWKLFVPADLAYGPRGRPKLGPNATLIFEVELLEVSKPQPPQTNPAAAPPIKINPK